MDGLDFVPPVGDRALCESWDTYLPDYIKSAGSKERHQKLQRMIHQSPTGSSYVSMRYKMPDLFADVIASYSEEETSNEWGHGGATVGLQWSDKGLGPAGPQ